MRIVPVLLAVFVLMVPTTISAETNSFTKAGWLISPSCGAGAGTLTLDGDELRFEAIMPCSSLVGYAATWSFSDDCSHSTLTPGKFSCQSVSESGVWYTLRVDPEYTDDPDSVLVLFWANGGDFDNEFMYGGDFRDVPV